MMKGISRNKKIATGDNVKAKSSISETLVAAKKEGEIIVYIK